MKVYEMGCTLLKLSFKGIFEETFSKRTKTLAKDFTPHA
jgi:hypothetical protein